MRPISASVAGLGPSTAMPFLRNSAATAGMTSKRSTRSGSPGGVTRSGVAIVIIGLSGLVVPARPGHMLILAGLLVGAWANGFTRVGVWTLVVLGVIALASYGVDFVAVALGAKRLGASPRAMTGA